MPITTTLDQETLRSFWDRRHPEYAELADHWQFCGETYKGGRAWFQNNVFKYLKEGSTEFKDRLERAYRFNHTREAVDLIQKYIFKSKVIRNEEDAGPEIVAFWGNVTLSGLDIQQFMILIGQLSSIFGRIWIFTDTNVPEGQVLTAADAKKAKARVYAYFVSPQDILDIGFADDGTLNWIKVRETVRDDLDPITSSGDVNEQVRLWTRTDWTLFEEVDAGSRGRIVRKVSNGVNPLGEVPCFWVDHMIGENKYSAPGLIDDIAYLDRAVANYLSNLDAIIQDQTFSQLAMPAQGMTPGDDAHNTLVEMGTKRIFTYDGEGGVRPEYISPDPKQAGVIITVINKIINEIYHTIGMAGERTKQDNAVGIDNSSGVAKAYDFERVNALLKSKASSLENAENRLVEQVLKWQSQDKPAQELVKYPDTFDVRSLFDEFVIAEKLALIDGPDEVRREQMKQVVDKMFPRLAEDLKVKILASISKWPPKIDLTLGTPPSKFGSQKKPAQAKRQGQVTKTTK